MVAMYNKKLATMERTKEVILAQLPEGEFKEWESKYVDRGQLILNVASIVIFFFIFFKLCTKLNITKHFQTILNFYFQRDSVEDIKVQVQPQPGQSKDRVETQQWAKPMKKSTSAGYKAVTMMHSKPTLPCDSSAGFS